MIINPFTLDLDLSSNCLWSLHYKEGFYHNYEPIECLLLLQFLFAFLLQMDTRVTVEWTTLTNITSKAWFHYNERKLWLIDEWSRHLGSRVRGQVQRCEVWPCFCVRRVYSRPWIVRHLSPVWFFVTCVLCKGMSGRRFEWGVVKTLLNWAKYDKNEKHVSFFYIKVRPPAKSYRWCIKSSTLFSTNVK